MTQVLKNHRWDEGTAFAHCISGDLDNPCHMTAGLAVTFRREFGKPLRSNCITRFLTFQKSDIAGAGVYELVTKPVFSGKPTKQSYDEAFTHLAKDFCKRGFNKLICSPMGCIRDDIPVEHFAEQIVAFQRKTNSLIKIIVYNECSARILKKGLSYYHFVNKLKKNISTAASNSQYCNPDFQLEKLNVLDSKMHSNSAALLDISNPFFGFSPIGMPENILREPSSKSSLNGKEASNTADEVERAFCMASLDDFPTLPLALNDSILDTPVNDNTISRDSLSVNKHDFLG